MIVRLGRVLFWVGLLGAGAISIGGMAEGHPLDGLLTAAVALGLGRGARYIMSNE